MGKVGVGGNGEVGKLKNKSDKLTVELCSLVWDLSIVEL